MEKNTGNSTNSNDLIHIKEVIPEWYDDLIEHVTEFKRLFEVPLPRDYNMNSTDEEC